MTTTFVTPEKTIRQQAAKDGVTHFATGIAVIKDGKLLVVRRAIHDSLGGFYELPGGGVDRGESLEQGAIRETYEETGLKVTKIISMFYEFDYETNSKPKSRQLNFLVQTADTKVVLSHEHDDYRWIRQQEIDRLHATDEMRACLYKAFGNY